MAEEWDKIKEFVTANAGLFEEMYSNYDYRKVLEFMESTGIPTSIKDKIREIGALADEVGGLASQIETITSNAERVFL